MVPKNLLIESLHKRPTHPRRMINKLSSHFFVRVKTSPFIEIFWPLSTMLPDNSTVEKGFHSSSTSRNTTETTDCEAPSLTTSWWKQKNIKILVAVTVMMVPIALSVGVVLSLRGNKIVKQKVNPMAVSGGHDTATFSEHSSSSQAILGQCNILQELQRPQPDASSAKVAIDGENLAVVSKGARQYGHNGNIIIGVKCNERLAEADEFNMYVEFYSLVDNGLNKVSGFQEEDITDFNWEYGQRNAALSDTTAVITFPSKNGEDRPVYTYRQDDGGLW